jgi:hypothetical protein
MKINKGDRLWEKVIAELRKVRLTKAAMVIQDLRQRNWKKQRNKVFR